jgi:hypothetical protein
LLATTIANPTPKAPISLPLTSSSLPEEPIREADDSTSKRKQKKLKPNPPGIFLSHLSYDLSSYFYFIHYKKREEKTDQFCFS